jgi:hypothetical protein
MLLALGGCTRQPPSEASMLKLPYQPEAARCHKDLPKLSPPYRDGFARLVSLASGAAAYEERFAQVAQEHEKIIEAGQASPPSGPLMEEDIYLVCLYDLLNAIVGTEVERLSGSGLAGDQKKRQLEALTRPIDALTWSGPIWENVEKPRLKKRVTDALARP